MEYGLSFTFLIKGSAKGEFYYLVFFDLVIHDLKNHVGTLFNNLEKLINQV